ncbi:hypothetical protein KUCAC02_012675 [Chaenocephalus aceratus]|uniref:Uncharacterized protein n=1 Tax=Chaenocephalus aceratus TaxID=36190 RepID=A0ACB9XBC4_CHAAC|nr:hypothetical protein KUCAC02_012675 [Chaenocephalus aceratus]
MRFSVEQINNSTKLLPNVSLGYEIFDHCSDLHNFPGILQLLSVNGLVQPWGEPHENLSKVIAVVGPFSSTNTLTVAPLFMTNLIPMVSYGAASSAFAEKAKFPSFLRTVHSNKEVIDLIFNIVKHFNWRWVAFLNSDDAYGIDGLELFNKKIKDTEICLAYNKGLNVDTNDTKIFKEIEEQKINTIIVFAPKMTAEALIESAVRLNVINRVWIAGDTWSLSTKLHKMKGIKNIGTVIGVSQPVVTIPGFSDFIHFSGSQTHCEHLGKKQFCNQACNCSSPSAEKILSVDPSYNFSIYSAVYAIAHALHKTLQCGSGRCNSNITLYPYTVLAELKQSNFTLLNQSIQFDENIEPKFGSYSIVFWNDSGEAEVIGYYKFQPSIYYYIDENKIQWYTDGEVPTSVCSQECLVGYSKKQDGMHKCCFSCVMCQSGTYVNITENPYRCIDCKDTEWSAAGSTSCNLRSVEYIPFTDTGAILIMAGAWALVGFTLAVSVLFAINYNTPVFFNRSSLSTEDVVAADPSFNFPVYTAVYAIAHALHNALQCGSGRCNDNITVFPHMVLAELKKSNFTLLNESIRFDENGDPNYGSYSVVFWNHSGDAEEIGLYTFHGSVHFFINNSKIHWYTNGEAPTSVCSSECPVGFAKKYAGSHKCCFNCKICPNGSYVNITEDAYRCMDCKDTEWSAAGSTSCNLRSVEYIPFTDTGAILIMVGAWALVGFTLAVSVLFAINYNTPVVRSAGGPMCFLILVCLSLCSISVFFYFGEPTTSFCILRFLPFLLFYTVCLACFVVRSFQIVCIFKIAAKFPKLHSWWIKYHGQWLVITVAFGIQALLLLIGYTCSPPETNKDTDLYPDKIILGCDLDLKATAGPVLFLLSLCFLCFVFSYMGKDLPKNYNEAKAITFCLLLLILTWIAFATEYVLYHGKYISILNALAILSSLYSFLVWYFLPKCYIMIFQSHRNTHEYFQGLIQNYTKTISQ